MKKSTAIMLLLAAALTLQSALPPAIQSPLTEFTGIKVYGKLDPETSGKLYLLNWVQLHINYNGGVDFQLRSEGVLLRDETRKLLYSPPAVPAIRYRQGSRVALEKIVADLTAKCTSQQQKALNIMRFCRDLYKKKPYPVDWPNYIFGGTEEELIAKGEILCEALARLQVALCEIAGIPGRIVMHIGGGHVTSELYMDGEWGYIDPRMGIYFLKADGRIASVQYLIDHPEVIDRQSDAVKADTVAYAQWTQRAGTCRTKYFSGRDLNLFEYYSLADSGRYLYHQIDRQSVNRLGLREINREYVKTINKWFEKK